MVLMESVFLSLLIGLIAGGKLGHLRRFPLRHGYLVILSTLIQAYIVYSAIAEPISGFTLPAAILLGSYVILIATCAINLRLPGMDLISLGLLLNLTVMVANNGFMPISPEQLRAAGFTKEANEYKVGSRLPRSKDVLIPASEIRLRALSDVLVIVLPVPFHSRFTRSVMSVGDVFVGVGIFFMAQAALGSRLALLKLRRLDEPDAQHTPASSPT